MSMEAVERYIQDLEAINNYGRVVKERDELSEKAATLEARLKRTSDELAGLKEFKVQLGESGEISLDEARQDFLRAMDMEIEKRTGERFEALKQEYEAKMPQVVYQRLVEILKGQAWPLEIAAVISAEVAKSVNRILYHSENWPDKFKVYYREEVGVGVKSGLDSEFERRVEEAAKAKAQQRLRELKNEEWPKWFSANIEPRIAELERKVSENAFQLLKGPWTFVCDQCDTTFSDQLTGAEIEALLTKGQIQIECINPACDDHFLFSSRRHRFRVLLHALIKTYVES